MRPGPASGVGRRNGKLILRHVDPLIALLDQHHWDVVQDGVFSTTIRLLAHQPGLLDTLEHPLLVADAVGAAQDLQKVFVDHALLIGGGGSTILGWLGQAGWGGGPWGGGPGGGWGA